MKTRYLLFILGLIIFLFGALFLTAQNRQEDPLRLDILENHFIGDNYLGALRKVPRARFFPAEMEPFTREDRPLPDERAGITPSPSTVLTVLEKLRVGPESSLLILGRGGGYAAALAAVLGADVTLLEESDGAANYRIIFEEIGVRVNLVGGSREGLSGRTWDAIFIHGAVDSLPGEISRLLSKPGAIAVPLNGTAGLQNCVIITFPEEGFTLEQIAETNFEPLEDPLEAPGN